MSTDGFDSWIELSPNEWIRFGDLAELMAVALHGETFAASAAIINFEDELPKLVRAGLLTPRDPLTRGPHPFPHGASLDDALLKPDEQLRAFLADRGIGLRITSIGSLELQHKKDASSGGSTLDAAVDRSQAAGFIPCLDVLKEAAALRYPIPAEGDDDALALALGWQGWALEYFEGKLNGYSAYRKVAVFVNGEPVPSFRTLHPDPLESWTVNVAGRAQLLNLLCDDPARVMPTIEIPAWPREVPRLLRLLPKDAQILLRRNWARPNGMGMGKPSDAIEEIEAVMSRQKDGWFTLCEAAQVLAETRREVNRKETVRRFLMAHEKGALPVHAAGSRFLMEASEAVSDAHDLLKASELDAWLLKTAVYRFPPAELHARCATVDKPVTMPGFSGAMEDEPASLPTEPMQKRAKLLEWFREAGGKRRKESGKSGTWGALTRVVERSGIDKDTLGPMLDKAIDEKRCADGFAQLAAKG